MMNRTVRTRKRSEDRLLDENVSGTYTKAFEDSNTLLSSNYDDCFSLLHLVSFSLFFAMCLEDLGFLHLKAILQPQGYSTSRTDP